MSEAAFQKKLQDALRQRGAWVAKYPAGPHGVKGVPDLMVCHLARFYAVECKAGDPRLARYALTVSQALQRDKVIAAGGVHLVAWPGNLDWVLSYFPAQ